MAFKWQFRRKVLETSTVFTYPTETSQPGPKTLKFFWGTYLLHMLAVSGELLIKCHGSWLGANDWDPAMHTGFVNVWETALNHSIGPDLAPWQYSSQSLSTCCFLDPWKRSGCLLSFLRTFFLITLWFYELPHILSITCFVLLKVLRTSFCYLQTKNWNW